MLYLYIVVNTYVIEVLLMISGGVQELCNYKHQVLKQSGYLEKSLSVSRKFVIVNFPEVK